MFLSFSPLILFLILIIFNAIFCKLDPTKVVVAINGGGNDYTDSNGISYDGDKYFSGGTSSDHGINYRIKNKN